MKKRDLKLNKYDISKNRYRELLYFCRQYREKKIKLASSYTVGRCNLTGMPGGGALNDSTQAMALNNIQLEKDIKLIEETAVEVAGTLADYIISNVCDDVPYRYIGAPCGINQFYNIRRKFFWLLAKKKNGD